MTLAASLLLSVSLALQPGAALRLYNPHDAAVDATVDCAGTPHAVRVEAHDTVDLASCAMATIESPEPLVAFETAHEDSVETQRILGTDAACEAFAVAAPLFGCRLGTAVVAVPQLAGAGYAWSVEGASVVSGHGTNRLVLTLGEGSSARIRATVTGECTASAEAVISLRNPLVLETFQVPAVVTANTETTVQWSYANGLTPASQLLSGEGLDAPVALGGGVRSYKWTPKTTGAKTLELRASYSPAISLEPPRRRRAMGTTRAIATECPSVLATASVQVGGCGTLNASIDTPESVEAGSTFTATIFLRTGETVKWTIEGGTIVSGDATDTVVAKAGDVPGNVKLYARVTAGPNCHETAEARVPVVERAVCNTAAPSVALSVDKVDCGSATIKATFTGTPPFSGQWSDGISFSTSAMTLTHEFKTTSTYTIRNFRDAQCAGQISQTAKVTSFGPSAHVQLVGGTCLPGAKAVATFTGTPPFTGKWYGGEWFTTSESTLETTELRFGVAQIEVIRDAQCPTSNNGSNRIDLEPRPTAKLRELSFCTTSNAAYASLLVDISSLERAYPPFTVYWSDGVVTKGGSSDYTILRSVTTTDLEKEYSIVRVAGKNCDALIDPDRSTAVVRFHALPAIDYEHSDLVSCLGSETKIRLFPGYHPDAQIHWSVTNGEIVSGQGTPEITLRQTKLPAAKVTVEATFPDASCITFPNSIQTYLYRAGEILDFSITPSTIPAGGTAEIHYKINDQIEYLSIGAFPTSRGSDFSLSASDCTDMYGRDCTIPYKDTHGPGSVLLTLYVGNECGSWSQPVQLTIQ